MGTSLTGSHAVEWVLFGSHLLSLKIPIKTLHSSCLGSLLLDSNGYTLTSPTERGSLLWVVGRDLLDGSLGTQSWL